MSTLRVDTIQNAAGTDSPISVPGTAKAWVNFNGTGTVAIRASYNVSSITDNGTGDYTVNFTTAMPDANYVLTGSADWSSANRGQNISPQTFAAGSIRFWSNRGYDGTVWSLQDPTYVSVAIFR